MDFTKPLTSKPNNKPRDHFRIGLACLVVGLLLLACVAAASFAFGMAEEVLLLRDIVSATTALPVYLILLFAVVAMFRGLFASLKPQKDPMTKLDTDRHGG